MNTLRASRSFKLGSKTQTLRLVEHTVWTHKYMARKKELLISTISSFKSFIKDPFWEPSIQSLGRRVLKLDKPVALR